jgi:hypothetical protein
VEHLDERGAPERGEYFKNVGAWKFH